MRAALPSPTVSQRVCQQPACALRGAHQGRLHRGERVSVSITPASALAGRVVAGPTVLTVRLSTPQDETAACPPGAACATLKDARVDIAAAGAGAGGERPALARSRSLGCVEEGG